MQTMPAFVVADFLAYAREWLLARPGLLVVCLAVVVLIVGIRIIEGARLRKVRRQAVESYRLSLVRARRRDD